MSDKELCIEDFFGVEILLQYQSKQKPGKKVKPF